CMVTRNGCAAASRADAASRRSHLQATFTEFVHGAVMAADGGVLLTCGGRCYDQPVVNCHWLGLPGKVPDRVCHAAKIAAAGEGQLPRLGRSSAGTARQIETYSGRHRDRSIVRPCWTAGRPVELPPEAHAEWPGMPFVRGIEPRVTVDPKMGHLARRA